MNDFKFNYVKEALKLLLTASVLCFLAMMSSCSDDDGEDQWGLDDRLIQEYLKEKGIKAKKHSSGFYYTVVKPNSSGDEVKKNDILSVYYKMTLLNGNEIDKVPKSSGKPKKFQIVDKSLIPKGLRLGSSLMKQGEIFRFYLPSHLAYGYYSYEDKIPANAVIIVESEIAEILKEDDQKALEKQAIETYIEEEEVADINEVSGLFYKMMEEGEGDKPEKGDKVEVKYVGKYLDGTVFDKTKGNKSLSFTIGTENIIEGFQEGLKLMQEGEKATLIIPSHMAYWSSLQVFPEEVREDLLEQELITQKIPPFSILLYEVELVEIEN